MIHVASDDGADERIEATTEHPFWVSGKGWIEASALRVGDPLKRLDDGPLVRVVDVSLSDRTADVFNFEVGDAHTYFIGAQAILVHNNSSPPKVYGIDGIEHGVGAYVSFQSGKDRVAARIVSISQSDDGASVSVEFPARSATGVELRAKNLRPEQAATIRASSSSRETFDKYFPSPNGDVPPKVVSEYAPGQPLPSSVLRNWATLPPGELVGRMSAAVGIDATDPLFDPSWKTLRAHGPSISLDKAMRIVYDTYVAHPSLALDPKGLLMHGSTSASLLSITQDTGGLVPTGELLKVGKPPMTGELVFGIGPGGVNRKALSTVFVSKPDVAYRYAVDIAAGQGAWSPEVGRSLVDTLQSDLKSEGSLGRFGQIISARLEIENQRQAYWDVLGPEERGLVTANYPVIWRMRPAPGREVMGVNSSVPLEMAVVGGVSWSEITSISVPTRYVPDVQSLAGRYSIPVRPLESLSHTLGR